MAQLNLLLHPEHGLAEVDREVEAKIVALARAPAAGAASGGTAEAAEEGFEQIGEAAHIAHVGRAAPSPDTGLTELVKTGFGLGVAEHLVGPADLLETVLSPGILVHIGVVLAGQTAVCPLDGVRVGVATDPQLGVVVGHQPACSSAEATVPSGPGPIDTFTKAWRRTRPWRW